ncbi:MAG: Tad domain-containing protein [Candidatus Acidiferrales bacterium]
MKRPYHRQSPGQILVLATISMVMLLGFTALAVDMGYLYSTRRRMQTAADAAAVAGATALRDGESYTSAADDVASFNGFTNSQNNVTVTVSEPTLPSPYPSDVTYVEVDISQTVPTYFLRVLGYKSMKVGARAVSGAVAGPACIYALDPSDSGTFSLTGNANINSQCGLIDDSTSSSGLSLTGNITLKATSIGVVGSSFSKSGNVTISPQPVENLAALPDPLSGQAKSAAPSAGTCTQQTGKSGSENWSGNIGTLTVPAGVYNGGISISGNVTAVTFSAGNYGNSVNFNGNGGSLVFNPGQYQNGGSGNSITLNGNTATSFNAGTYTFCGAVDIIGNSTVTLRPGTYFGGINITGNANVTFTPGTYILAGGGLTVTGNSTLKGTGVTFYDTSATGYAYAPIDLTGNETANLSAPTSGTFEGFLFFQDPSLPVGSAGITVVGNSSSTFDGIIYSPTTAITYVGNSSGSGYTILIGYTITVTGNSSFTIGNNYSSLADGAPIKSSALYE